MRNMSFGKIYLLSNALPAVLRKKKHHRPVHPCQFTDSSPQERPPPRQSTMATSSLKKPKVRYSSQSKWFVEHSSPDNSSLEDSSLENLFPGGGRFFAGVFFARIILRRRILL
jgi:hypothetical protein